MKPPRIQIGSVVEERDRPTLLLLFWCAVAVIAVEYLVLPFRTSAAMNAFIAVRAADSAWQNPLIRVLLPQIWWATGMIVLWVLIPRALFRKTGAEGFSIGLPRTAGGIGVYAAMIAVMIPLVFIASARPDFLRTYPMVKPAAGIPLTWSMLVGFWMCYVTILFSTEFFFRGVMLFALKPRLGVLSISVCAIPYAMIHVHKPVPEAFAAIAAGYILGYMALTTRSIGGGVLVHCSVAIGMDSLALWRTHSFPLHW